MHLGIIGKGRMGAALDAAVLDTEHEIVFRCDSQCPLTPRLAQTCDVIVDFSTAFCLEDNVRIALAARKPFVTGTTGWDDRMDSVEKLVTGSNGCFLYATNFSMGVALFRKLAAVAGRFVDSFGHYDIALKETHHTGKIDSPSGTALVLGRILLDEISRKEKLCLGNSDGRIDSNALQVSSIRLGTVMGTHTILLDCAEDFIELTHTSKGRAGFARGALRAAGWLSGRTGFFALDDMLEGALLTKENIS